MSYSSISRPWGLIPMDQTYKNIAIPANTSTTELAFGAYDEIALEFLATAPDCKVCVAADEAAATAAFASDDYHLRSAGDCVSYFKPQAGGSVFILNTTASAASAALNYSKIRH